MCASVRVLVYACVRQRRKFCAGFVDVAELWDGISTNEHTHTQSHVCRATYMRYTVVRPGMCVCVPVCV